MGDWFETIADVEATAEDAAGLAAVTLAWLVDTGIVLAEATDCVLGDAGHPPGPRYATAVTEPDPHLFNLSTNGVEVITGRTVFYSMGAEQVTCPHCRHVTASTDDRGRPNQTWHEMSDVLGVWPQGAATSRR